MAPGHLADLVCLTGDPLTDIGAAAVRRVMVGGHQYDVPELLEPFRPSAVAARSDALGGTPGNRVRAAAPSARERATHYWHEAEWQHAGCCRSR